MCTVQNPSFAARQWCYDDPIIRLIFSRRVIVFNCVCFPAGRCLPPVFSALSVVSGCAVAGGRRADRASGSECALSGLHWYCLPQCQHCCPSTMLPLASLSMVPHQYQQKPRTVIKLICHWCVSLLQGCVRFGRAAGRPAGPTLFVPWPRAGSVVVCRPGVFYVCLSRCVSMAQGGSSAPRPVSGRPAGGFGEQQPSADQSLSQISASHAGNRGHLTRIHTVSFTTHTHRPFHFMFVHVCRVFRICFVCENVKLILCVVL